MTMLFQMGKKEYKYTSEKIITRKKNGCMQLVHWYIVFPLIQQFLKTTKTRPDGL